MRFAFQNNSEPVRKYLLHVTVRRRKSLLSILESCKHLHDRPLSNFK
jgi:hypothetical protein